MRLYMRFVIFVAALLVSTLASLPVAAIDPVPASLAVYAPHPVVLRSTAIRFTTRGMVNGTTGAALMHVTLTVAPAECGAFAGGGSTVEIVADASGTGTSPFFTLADHDVACTVTAEGTIGLPLTSTANFQIYSPADVVVASTSPASPSYVPVPMSQAHIIGPPGITIDVSFKVFGYPLDNEDVQFNVAGCGSMVPGEPGPIVNTFQWGYARLFYVLPQVIGRCTVTATLLSAGTVASVDFVGFDAAGLTVSPSQLTTTTNQLVNLDLAFRTGNGEPMANTMLSFKSAFDNTVAGGVVLPNGELWTDGAGHLVAALQTNGKAGSYVLTANLWHNLADPVDVSRAIVVNQSTTQTSAVHPVVTLASGDNQVAAIGTLLAQPLQVRLVGSNGNVIANAPIEFVVDPSGPTGIFPPTAAPSASTSTDASGLAQIAFKPTAGIGPGTIYARVFDNAAQAYVTATIHFTSTFANGASTADFQDIWWNPAQSGWGFAIAQGNAGLFEVLYTYDAAGQPTWFTATNATWTSGFGSTSAGNLYAPTSSPYYAYDASRFNAGPANSALAVAFTDPDHAQLTTSVLDGGAAKALQRYVFADVAAAKRGVGGLWWGGLAQNGWGLSIAEQGGALFVAWYTYDAAGKPLWFSMSEGSWSGSTWSGPVFKSTRNASGQVQTTRVGSFSVAFAGTSAGTFHFDVEGHQGTIAIQRFVF